MLLLLLMLLLPLTVNLFGLVYMWSVLEDSEYNVKKVNASIVTPANMYSVTHFAHLF